MSENSPKSPARDADTADAGTVAISSGGEGHGLVTETEAGQDRDQEGDDGLPNRPTQSADRAADDQDIEAQNESEAETLISSPVKKREAQKRVNGIKQEQSIDTVLSNAAEKDTVEVEEPAEEGEAEDNAAVESRSLLHKDDADENRVKEDDDDSSDLSVHSSRSSQSPEPALDEVSELDDDAGHLMSRKRKFRASSVQQQTSMEPPKRRRRASTNVATISREKSARSSDEPSPPPRLRSHRRTTSAQTIGMEGGVENNSAKRQRRGNSQFPAREAKGQKEDWESDSSSGASHQQQQNRLTRNINRSVSTPGRTMGRDHKRHVNKYGFTRLAEACESGELEAVKEWREKDPEQLEQREFAGNTPLQVASLNGYPEIVQYLLSAGCNPHCANTDKDTPLIDAVENGHLEVVRLLLSAGVDPLRQNMKGQQAMDVITDETDDGPEIKSLLRSAIEDWTKKGQDNQSLQEDEPGFRPGPTKGLQFMARTYDNLVKLVSNNDRSGVQEFLDARVPVDNDVVAAAARTGDLFLLNMLLADLNPKRARQRAEKPMLAVIGTAHIAVVKTLTELDQFNPTWRSKSTGLTWYEIAEERQGTYWRQERTLLHKLYQDAMNFSRLSSSPVSKRDKTVRRPRNDHAQIESDSDDVADTDSREFSRNRRRLMSKKDMRAASNRRPTPSGSAASDESGEERTSASPHADESLLKKSGRTRDGQASSPGSRTRDRRLRSSSSVQEKPGVSGSASQDNHEHGQSEDKTGDDHPMLESAEPTAADQRVKAEAEDKARRTAKAGEIAVAKLKRKMADDIAERERKAAEAKQKEELAARQREEEAQRQKQREEAAARRELDYQRMMDAMPPALRHVVGIPDSHTAVKRQYVRTHFTRVRVTYTKLLDENQRAGYDAEERWMLNYTAAGLLGSKVAAQLLMNSPSDPNTHDQAHDDHDDSATDKSLPSQPLPSIPLTAHQRSMFISQIGSETLIEAIPTLPRPKEDFDAYVAAANELDRAIIAERKRLVENDAIRLIRYKDFLRLVEEGGDEHLEGLKLEPWGEHVAFNFGSDIAATDQGEAAAAAAVTIASDVKAQAERDGDVKDRDGDVDMDAGVDGDAHSALAQDT